jgi:uncharacterized membrane protein
MSWIIFAVTGYAINAVVSLMDRFLVAAKKVPNPFMYAFYVCILSAGSLLAFLFDPIATFFGFPHIFPAWSGVSAPGFETIVISILSGLTMFLSLYLLYESLRRKYASDVIPVVTATAVVTTLVAELSVGRSLSSSMLVGVILIVLGTLLISHFRFDRVSRMFAVAAGITFGLQTISMGILLDADFDNGFIWSRVALVAVAILAYLFVILPFRKAARKPKVSASAHAKGVAWVVANKILAGFAAILIFRAIEGGSEAVVQALSGTQFLVILGIGLLIGNKTPEEYGESYSASEIPQKAISILFIIAGMVFIFLP